jgi:hypothetical protein
MKIFRKRYTQFILFFITVMTPAVIFLYESKKLAGIKDLFDIEDEDEL